jgi:hypothetical protein
MSHKARTPLYTCEEGCTGIELRFDFIGLLLNCLSLRTRNGLTVSNITSGMFYASLSMLLLVKLL